MSYGERNLCNFCINFNILYKATCQYWFFVHSKYFLPQNMLVNLCFKFHSSNICCSFVVSGYKFKG